MRVRNLRNTVNKFRIMSDVLRIFSHSSLPTSSEKQKEKYFIRTADKKKNFNSNSSRYHKQL